MLKVYRRNGHIVGVINWRKGLYGFYCSTANARNTYGPYKSEGQAKAAMIRRGFLVKRKS